MGEVAVEAVAEVAVGEMAAGEMAMGRHWQWRWMACECESRLVRERDERLSCRDVCRVASNVALRVHVRVCRVCVCVRVRRRGCRVAFKAVAVDGLRL